MSFLIIYSPVFHISNQVNDHQSSKHSLTPEPKPLINLEFIAY